MNLDIQNAEADISPREPLSPESKALRRRSQSISDDTGVIKTNDDATECKRSLAIVGYVKDPYVELFCWQTVRKDPEINRGYWARVSAVRSVVDHFLRQTNRNGQIVSLGAGFDTLYFQLAREYAHPCGMYLEMDFSSVTAKKIHHIMKPSGTSLKSLIGDTNSIKIHNHTDLISNCYALIGCDLRQSHELTEKLKLLEGLADWSRPTLILAECLFVYMTPEQGDTLIKHFLKLSKNVLFVNYEQANMADKFGSVMLNNLHERGIALPGVACCESLQSQIDRFKSAGCGAVRAATMSDVYKSEALSVERDRIEKLEFLDENELLDQLLDHYCLVAAASCDEAMKLAPVDLLGL